MPPSRDVTDAHPGPPRPDGREYGDPWTGPRPPRPGESPEGFMTPLVGWEGFESTLEGPRPDSLVR